MLGKSNESIALCRRCLLVNQHHRLRWIRIGIRITKRRIGLDRSDYGKPIKLLSVPASIANMPREQCLIADESNLTVREALRDINVGAASFKIIARDLCLSLACEGYSAQSGDGY